MVDLFFGRKNERDGLAFFDQRVKERRIKLVFAVVEATFTFARKEKIAIPDVLWLACCLSRPQVERRSSLKGCDRNAIFHRLDAHPPIASVRCRMIIAVVDQSLQIESDNGCSVHKLVLNESCIFAILHPNALFDQHVSELIGPDWNFSIELKLQYG